MLANEKQELRSVDGSGTFKCGKGDQLFSAFSVEMFLRAPVAGYFSPLAAFSISFRKTLQFELFHFPLVRGNISTGEQTPAVSTE